MSIFDPKRELIVHHKFLLGDERIPAVCALSRRRLQEILLAAAQRSGADRRPRGVGRPAWAERFVTTRGRNHMAGESAIK